MKKYINGNGFLTEDGRAALSPLQKALNQAIREFGPESESELRTLGAVLSKMVGDTITDRIQTTKELEAKLDAMSDEQFNAFMTAKYGQNWQFVTCTPEEGKRSLKGFREKMEATMEDIRKNYRIQHHGFNPRRK